LHARPPAPLPPAASLLARAPSAADRAAPLPPPARAPNKSSRPPLQFHKSQQCSNDSATRLALKTRQPFLVQCEPLRQSSLQCNVAAQLHVACAIHLTHAASAQERKNLICADLCFFGRSAAERVRAWAM